MTRSAQPVRAVGQAGSASGRPSAPVVLVPRRQPGQVGPIHLIQLLLVEVVLIALVASVFQGLVAVIAAGVGGAVLLLMAMAKIKGRWWLEQQLMTWRYRRRRRGGPGTYGDNVRLAALRQLAPSLTVENVPVMGGAEVGVARDDAGWYAVAAIVPETPLGDVPSALPLDSLVAALAGAEQPGAVLQVVTQTVPAPGIGTPAASAAGQSYRQLIGELGPVPADRSMWVVVRLDARALAEALADHQTDLDGAPALVAALIRRVAKSLRRAGLSHRLLNADELVNVLVRSCDLEPGTQQDPAAAPREAWSEWHSARLAHRSYWIRDWPPVDKAAAVLDWISRAPAAMTSVALILTPDPGRDTAELRGLVRVTAPAPELPEVCLSIARGAQQHSTDLFPLDGEQGPAVYASAPTGGGAR